MSAGNLGSRLLQEVKVEGLDDTEVLHTLRIARGSQQNRLLTGHQTIDQLLQAFVKSDAPPPRHSSVAKSHQVPVLELVGVSPCSGKTQLLSHLIGLTLLPSEYGGIKLGGENSAVLLFDLGSSISVLRLQSIMANHVQSCVGKSSESVSLQRVVNFVQSSLEHLHLFRPQSSLSLLATFSNLESYIFNTASHFSANRQVGLIVLHHVDAFLWQDRLDDAEDPTNGGDNFRKSSVISDRFRDLAAQLGRLHAKFDCLVIATSSALSTMVYVRTNGLIVPILRSHLPNAWKSFVTLRLLIQRDSVRKFPLGVSAEEAAREADQRREVVERCLFSARLDWSESDDWREETRNAVKALKDGGDLSFRVTPKGIDFDIENRLSS
ncbi:MAG: hypothetical protein Q9216_006565 [Gyalolechia sp. 2 TL-2023]